MPEQYMCLNLLYSKKEVAEKYRIPADQQDDFFLKCPHGGGHEQPVYTENVVDRFADIYCDPDRAIAVERSAEQTVFLSPADAAKKLRLNVQTVSGYRRAGTIVASKVGRKWLISERNLNSFIQQSEEIYGHARVGK